MSAGAVVFDHVWKKFRRGESHDSLRDLIPALARRAVGRGGPRDELSEQEFWALRDISFDVKPGEALGIIGPNGAGKSTVLKLLTRILKPTRGHCEARGRVGALIEIAAGFHPDLTGRENVYLQGTIMGMRRHEIARKFDEIVEFAGIGSFIDTPLKRYSSGMNARLGFAVAAHLDPDVLIIDEVLAVGDWAFQTKAFERIRAIVAQQVPVVVVSHQLDRLVSLCTHAVLLQRGALVRAGTPAECVEAYVAEQVGAAPAADPHAVARIDSSSVVSGQPVVSGGRAQLLVAGSVSDALDGGRPPSVSVYVRSVQSGEVVFESDTTACGVRLPASGPFTVEVDLQMNVPSGLYIVEVRLWDRRHHTPLAYGPSSYVQVVQERAFTGTVQMNPRMRILPPAPAAAVAALRQDRPG